MDGFRLFQDISRKLDKGGENTKSTCGDMYIKKGIIDKNDDTDKYSFKIEIVKNYLENSNKYKKINQSMNNPLSQ